MRERKMEMDRILCDELLEEVFRRLPQRSTFSSHTANVSLVSKRWLRLYRSTRSTLSLGLFIGDCTPRFLSSFLSHFPHLSSLSIATSLDSPDQLLLSVASSCPKLTGLCLKSKPVPLFPLLSLSTSCPHLTSLSIVLSGAFSFHWLVFLHSLLNLAVSFNFVSSEFEHVDASSKGNFDDAELKLETLYLLGIRRGHRGFNWLWKSCKNLKKLQLHCCEGIGDDTLVSSFINCLQGLQDLELKICGSIVGEVLSRLVENCKSLNSLLILGSDCCGEALLQFITRSCCNLRQLDLSLPLDLKNNHLLAVAEKFRGLSSLRINKCFRVTGEGLKTMALAMSNELEELALINCNMVGREPRLLTTLGQSLRNLRKLDLSYNKILVDKEFISMLAWCNGLRELKVRGCLGLTKASVVSMFKSCKQLESVDIMDCDGIKAEAVELFVLNCLQLRQIHVEESKVSDVSRSWALKKFIAVLGY